jgi:integrase/recombinase XerD
VLTTALDAYVALRRSVGFKFGEDGSVLRSYGRFAVARGDTHVRADRVLEWAAQATSPGRRERRLRIVVRFARHAKAEDALHEIPPRHAFGRERSPQMPPYIYPRDEIRSLLDAARMLGPSGSLRPRTYYTLFGLIACTGLRISEALAFRIADYADGVLVVRGTKFDKSRLVPLHVTAIAALDEYIRHRQQVRSRDDHLFISAEGRPIRYKHAYRVFRRLVTQHAGDVAVCRKPTIHGLRHTFAVRSLESSPNGRDHVGWHIRALSTYLGHVTVGSTYWYLRATPHLMRDLADLCRPVVEGRAP